MTSEKDILHQGIFPVEDIGPTYVYESYIGSGSYGCVCRARNTETGEKVAIKKFSNIFKSNTMTLRLLRELRILQALKTHPRIIKLLDIIAPRHLVNFTDLFCPNGRYIVMQLMDTDLSRIINSQQHLTRLHIQYILYQILIATKCLHKAKIFHRDLKPQNILINESCDVKICDFGLSRGQPDYDSSTRKLTKLRHHFRHVVTRWYRAPEVILLTEKYTRSIDIWSIGCIFAEILMMLKGNAKSAKNRNPLFPGMSCAPLSPRKGNSTDQDFMDQLSMIFFIIGTPKEIVMNDFKNCQNKNLLRSPPRYAGVDLRSRLPKCNQQEIDLLKKMLQFSPSKRLTVDQALEHPYFENIRERSQEITLPEVNFDFESKSMSRCGRGLLIREIMNSKIGSSRIRNHITTAYHDILDPNSKQSSPKNPTNRQERKDSKHSIPQKDPKKDKTTPKGEKLTATSTAKPKVSSHYAAKTKPDCSEARGESKEIVSKKTAFSSRFHRRRTSIDKKEVLQ